MNANQIEVLIDLINKELPFTPPFQYKKFGEAPFPLKFSEDVSYLGDWSADCLRPYSSIEWICVRPQYLKNIGRLVPPKVFSCEVEFVNLLRSQNVSFESRNDTILIYCNKNN
ncbi:DUF6678 family protein [Pseudoalteromonas luteoviolacea]|uniref:DUF6678 family protein n=1 Tax=Pseudoalteromonas luteoviolacea TaxID=43657 RepID=UPI00114E8B6C|nr:DUF6678 family protein [Pseudoalteromonas luteoviolacea]